MELINFIILIFVIFFTFLEIVFFWHSYKTAQSFGWFEYKMYLFSFVTNIFAQITMITTMYLNVFSLLDFNFFLFWISIGISFIIMSMIASSRFRKERFGSLIKELKNG